MENVEECKATCRTTTLIAAVILAGMYVLNYEDSRSMIILSGIMSAIWVTWYGYDYRSPDQILIGKLNVTTWVIWTIGLVIAALFYKYLKNKTQITSIYQRIAVVAVLWTVICMTIEWIGYNVLDIKLKTNYSGLFGLELMHGPWYLKIYYLTAWILFFSLLGIW